jgi:hypothetical protein
MIQASKVTFPSLSGYPPKPTQQSILFSMCLAPASTASKALPFLLNISHAAALTGIPLSHVEITIGFNAGDAKELSESAPNPTEPN